MELQFDVYSDDGMFFSDSHPNGNKLLVGQGRYRNRACCLSFIIYHPDGGI
jgi:hypothetical protein